MSKRHQIAAIPYRRAAANRIQVLLVTSRDTGRWVVPKGWPWRDVADFDAAAGEAWEEAGVRGEISPQSIGAFAYQKRRNGKSQRVEVSVYLLEVREEADSWPEYEERRRQWSSPSKAAELVNEPDLRTLLQSLGSALPKSKPDEGR